MNQQLTKAERINSKIKIETIFKKGKSVFSFPYRFVWLENKGENPDLPVDVLLSVGKKRFKRAVDRNQIKRYIREAYRINKHLLWDVCAEKGININLGIVYVGKEIGDFKIHDKIMKKNIQKMLLEVTDNK